MNAKYWPCFEVKGGGDCTGADMSAKTCVPSVSHSINPIHVLLWRVQRAFGRSTRAGSGAQGTVNGLPVGNYGLETRGTRRASREPLAGRPEALKLPGLLRALLDEPGRAGIDRVANALGMSKS